MCILCNKVTGVKYSEGKPGTIFSHKAHFSGARQTSKGIGKQQPCLVVINRTPCPSFSNSSLQAFLQGLVDLGIEPVKFIIDPLLVAYSEAITTTYECNIEDSIRSNLKLCEGNTYIGPKFWHASNDMDLANILRKKYEILKGYDETHGYNNKVRLNTKRLAELNKYYDAPEVEQLNNNLDKLTVTNGGTKQETVISSLKQAVDLDVEQYFARFSEHMLEELIKEHRKTNKTKLSNAKERDDLEQQFSSRINQRCEQIKPYVKRYILEDAANILAYCDKTGIQWLVYPGVISLTLQYVQKNYLPKLTLVGCTFERYLKPSKNNSPQPAPVTATRSKRSDDNPTEVAKLRTLVYRHEKQIRELKTQLTQALSEIRRLTSLCETSDTLSNTSPKP